MRCHHLLALVLLLACGTVAAKSIPLAEDARHRTYLQNYKDMLLAACISKVYAAAPAVQRDAEASANAFNEFGSYDAEHYIDMQQALLNSYAARVYSSITTPDGKALDGGPPIRLDLMKCIDLYHSRELDTLSRKAVTKPNSTFAQENPDLQ